MSDVGLGKIHKEERRCEKKVYKQIQGKREGDEEEQKQVLTRVVNERPSENQNIALTAGKDTLYSSLSPNSAQNHGLNVPDLRWFY